MKMINKLQFTRALNFGLLIAALAGVAACGSSNGESPVVGGRKLNLKDIVYVAETVNPVNDPLIIFAAESDACGKVNALINGDPKPPAGDVMVLVAGVSNGESVTRPKNGETYPIIRYNGNIAPAGPFSSLSFLPAGTVDFSKPSDPNVVAAGEATAGEVKFTKLDAAKTDDVEAQYSVTVGPQKDVIKASITARFCKLVITRQNP